MRRMALEISVRWQPKGRLEKNGKEGYTVSTITAKGGAGNSSARACRNSDRCRHTVHAPTVVVNVVAVKVKADVAADSSPEEEN